MAEYPGNVIPSPSYTKGTSSVDDELMYSMQGMSQKGVTLKPGQGVLPLGTPLAYETTAKQWVFTKESTVNAGDAVTRGFLRQTVDTGADANGAALQGNIVTRGQVKLAKVTAALTALTGEQTPIADILTDLNARQETVLGYIDF